MTPKITESIAVVERGGVLKTRCPKEYVTEEMIHQRVVAAKLEAGDFLKVFCMNHEESAVLHFAEYLVYDARSTFDRPEFDDRPQSVKTAYSIMRIVDWKSTPAAEPEAPAFNPVEENVGDDAPKIQWNLGKQAHEVVDGKGNVLAEFTKEDGGRAAAEAFLNRELEAA